MSEHSLIRLLIVSRATPLPLDERRAALIAATEPLLEQFGRDVSTRQIAEAAGVAEGTIFRAFPTKEALIDAVLEEVFDNQRTCDELAAIDPALPLEARLISAVTVLQARLRRVFALFHSLRLSPPDKDSSAFRARQRRRQREAQRRRRLAARSRSRSAPDGAGRCGQRAAHGHLLAHPPDPRRSTIHRAGADRRSDPARHRQSTFDRTAVMLIRLLRTYLVPYRRLLLGVVILQLIGTMASLFLPSLNASIIDEGVAKGDTEFIWNTGKVMLAVSLVQVICAIAATYFGARTAMGFGRDVRGVDLPARTGLLLPRAQPVRGAVADHPHDQRRAAGADAGAAQHHDVRRRADHHDRRRHHGPARGHRSVLAGRRRHPAAGHLDLPGDSEDAAAVPADADPDRPGQPGAARADRRHPGGPGLRPRTVRDRPLRRGQRRPDRDRHLGGAADGVDLPDRDVHPEHVQRRRALVRRAADRLRGRCRSAR